ncbi:MAG: hypothetical protein JXP48_04460 [Acidobacteria bacterium]|nr:hypothetical protein [Acidobacteriota bacterium]
MPDRYHIATAWTPGRFFRTGRFGGIDWREDCSRCTNCVKLRCCFDVYAHEGVHDRDPLAPVGTLNECKACFSCVQGCTKGLLGLSVNPEFLEMGDGYWTPDILLSTWEQADSGKIPVSGAGYRGRFTGPGFDSIWTDMSEIVRPTRDGIHGREYISTTVDIGPKPMRLRFSPEGKLLSPPAELLELQIPVVLDLDPRSCPNFPLPLARALAAGRLRTVAMVGAAEAARLPAEVRPFVVPVLDAGDASGHAAAGVVDRMAELVDGPGLMALAGAIRRAKPGAILSVRLRLAPATADRITALMREGFRVFHLSADPHGCERREDGSPGRHIRDALRDIHGRLVDSGVRDEVTLIVSGGIALAEHMAKSIVCGADLVGVDTALAVAIGCRVCRGETAGGVLPGDRCPAGIEGADAAYAAARMVNLMGAWHSQLIEVLGAMGIREVRRLRGETGRAIFMEEIEREAFGDLVRVGGEGETA